MEVHFSPEVEMRLQQVASANGKDAEQLVKDAVARMLENQARFIAGVQRGLEQADPGEFLEHQDFLEYRPTVSPVMSLRRLSTCLPFRLKQKGVQR
jgi:predicted transcriptional regulator